SATLSPLRGARVYAIALLAVLRVDGLEMSGERREAADDGRVYAIALLAILRVDRLEMFGERRQAHLGPPLVDVLFVFDRIRNHRAAGFVKLRAVLLRAPFAHRDAIDGLRKQGGTQLAHLARLRHHVEVELLRGKVRVMDDRP